MYTLVYDSARQRVMQFVAGNPNPPKFQGSRGTWFCGRAELQPAEQEVRIGNPVGFSLSLPSDAGNTFFCGLSLGSEVGIPIATSRLGSVLVWPLRPHVLVATSLQVPSLWGVLDQAGRGSPSLMLPPDPSLVGLSVSASAVTLDRTFNIGSITRDVRALVVR